jgi:ABC-type multidrug transport system ATPase subunit
MTLLLGPPGAGKTSLLLALAGTLPSSLQLTGCVTYNGHTMDEFEARRSAAYVSQNDVHMGELTVRETVKFSAKCQGIGHRYGNKNSLNIPVTNIAQRTANIFYHFQTC